MIVRERPGLVTLFFILRGSVVQRIILQVLAVALVSAAIVAAHRLWPGRVPSLDGAPFALLGIALSIFLGFRNSACYERWWEARRQWGLVTAGCRDLSRRSLILSARGREADRAALLGFAIAFVHALVDRLRDGAASLPLADPLPAGLRARAAASRFPPDLLLREAGARVAGLRAEGLLGEVEAGALDAALTELNAAACACERIRNTPVPFGYTLLLHRTAYLFCFLLPFGYADVLQWGTPMAAALVAYTFFGLDALGDELEEPFGTSPNDLPIAALALTIEINLREAMGEADLPPLPTPVDHLLL